MTLDLRLGAIINIQLCTVQCCNSNQNVYALFPQTSATGTVTTATHVTRTVYSTELLRYEVVLDREINTSDVIRPMCTIRSCYSEYL